MAKAQKRGIGANQGFHKIVVPRNLPAESFLRPDPALMILHKRIASLPSPKWNDFEKKYPAEGAKFRKLFGIEVKKYYAVELGAIRTRHTLDKFQKAYRPIKKCFPQFVQLLQGMTGMWFKPSAMPHIVKALMDFQKIMQRDTPEVRRRLNQRKKGRGRDSIKTPLVQRRLVSWAIYAAHEIEKDVALISEAIYAFFNVTLSPRQIQMRIDNIEDNKLTIPRPHRKK